METSPQNYGYRMLLKHCKEHISRNIDMSKEQCNNEKEHKVDQLHALSGVKSLSYQLASELAWDKLTIR